MWHANEKTLRSMTEDILYSLGGEPCPLSLLVANMSQFVQKQVLFLFLT